MFETCKLWMLSKIWKKIFSRLETCFESLNIFFKPKTGFESPKSVLKLWGRKKSISQKSFLNIILQCFTNTFSVVQICQKHSFRKCILALFSLGIHLFSMLETCKWWSFLKLVTFSNVYTFTLKLWFIVPFSHTTAPCTGSMESEYCQKSAYS